MKDTAKKAKKALAMRKSGMRKAEQSSELPWYLRRVLCSINSDSEGRQAFRFLTLRGCDRRTLLENLNAYCGGTIDEARRALKAALNFGNRLKKAAVRLNEDADLIVRMEQDRQRLAGITLHSPVDLPSELREFAESLAALARAYDTNLKNVRPNRKGNISAGRTWFLAELVWHIEEKKVEDNPYPLLARLVAAVRKDSERNYVMLADALRNAVKRIR
jgi:hypothetical protein